MQIAQFEYEVWKDIIQEYSVDAVIAYYDWMKGQKIKPSPLDFQQTCYGWLEGAGTYLFVRFR